MRCVLLRGLMREQRHWGDFVAQLQHALPGARLLMPDIPGNGRRHRERSPAAIPPMVNLLRAGLPAAGRGDGPLHLIGLSMGGMLAIDWATAFPQEVAGIVLINSSARPHATLLQRLRPAAWPSLLRLLLQAPEARERTILSLTSSSPQRHQQTLAAWQVLAAEAPVSVANGVRQLLAAARFTAPVERPPAPVLLLASAGDRLVNPECSRRLAAAWGAPVHLHPSAGHDLPLEDPAWVATRVAAWISR